MDAELAALIGGWAAATLRSATPLIFVTLGETLTQRTGLINLGVEGQMLAGACAGFAVGAATGNPWLGFAAGAGTGMLLSWVYAGLVLGAGANQIAAGISVWLIALGATSMFGRAIVGKPTESLPSLSESLGASTVQDTPVIGIMMSQLTFATPMAFIAVFFAAWWLQWTRPGLRWRVVGESALIALENGIRPLWVRLQGVTVGGLLAGLGGAVLSVDYTQTWAQEITKGQGLIAVGLVIVARWQPLLVLPICLTFGLAQVAALRFQSSGIEGSSFLMATFPYVMVILILLVTHLRARHINQMPADLRDVFA